MIYVAWIEGDSEGEFDWFAVFPKKSEAMTWARGQAFDPRKKVVYLPSCHRQRGRDRNRSLPYGSEKAVCDFFADTTVVVEQRTSLYHGA